MSCCGGQPLAYPRHEVLDGRDVGSRAEPAHDVAPIADTALSAEADHHEAALCTRGQRQTMALGLLSVRALLVLWDIDHTLTENHGVNKEIYALAFELLTGRHAERPARTDGRTEPEIMLNMLAAHGIEAAPGYLARIPEALVAATEAKAATLREHGHELPGARAALAAFQTEPGIAQSVLTGNIRPNAITKLSVFELDGYINFDAGGYGSDDKVRANLVGIAQVRASGRYGQVFDKMNTVLVGDTLRDVQAGLRGGARVIAVATGADSAKALLNEGADIVLPDLRDTLAVTKAVADIAG
jgi:phosphoglycolate phosphatase